MSKSRLPMYLGLAAAAAGGYYLYSAGGDPKRATRKFEVEENGIENGRTDRGGVGSFSRFVDDASRAGSKIRSESNKALGAEQLGKDIDEAAKKAQRADERAALLAKEGVDKFEKARHDAARDVNAKIDAFDKTVEQKAAEAKSGVSSWFGKK
ncbi:hypothetical protein PAAG_07916 [Paracoccidioides lutzii Pb01]|uniref:Calcofluor white hypersensitive protein n=1 Tax=Paracoccidioides lutzii (strain ATCC MYA-826 / Pb01) TaxID=502779 RepID=C1HAT7_PARBA|nr:hypothetical protein PAAG_07916 [Paracoccidioides lutzii Pb01]EEH37498.1 hypothetical protein PAAG_07916 [Paracoccidioides lutzii Pb01]